MKKHGVIIDDLYAATKGFGPEMFSGPGNVHYTQQGYKMLATKFVEQVAEALKRPEPDRACLARPRW